MFEIKNSLIKKTIKKRITKIILLIYLSCYMPLLALLVMARSSCCCQLRIQSLCLKEIPCLSVIIGSLAGHTRPWSCCKDQEDCSSIDSTSTEYSSVLRKHKLENEKQKLR